MPKIIRITTVPVSLKFLLTGQMKFMKENGFESIMVSADGKEIEEIKKSEGCPHFIIPMTRKISPIQDFICLLQLVRLIRKERPDIVHSHTPKAGLIGMLAAKISGVSLKIHTIAGLPLMTAKGMKKKLLIGVEKLTYWCADYVLPNSYSIFDYVENNNFTLPSKLHVIGKGSSNGIDLNVFSKSVLDNVKTKNLKKTINYDGKNIYFLTVGRVVRDKGIVELVDAFTQVKKTYPNIRLLIVGPFEKERTEELLPSKTLNAIKSDIDIRHINWSNEVEYYMSIADFLIHPSYREGFPNVPLQAGAMECPIICSEILGNIDIVTDNLTGLHFEVGNTKDLMSKIQYALENREEMKIFAKRLRKKVEEDFSRMFVHQSLKAFYYEKLNEVG